MKEEYSLYSLVDQNHLQVMIIVNVTNSAVPPPPQASATGHQMEKENAMEPSREEEKLGVTQACVGAGITSPANLEKNVFQRLTCVMENLSVKIYLM